MKYREIYNTIKEKITGGIYPPGKAIPNTKELEKTYSVSQTTITKALALLKGEHLVQRIKSKGTFVLDPKTSDYLKVIQEKRIGFVHKGTLSSFFASRWAARIYQGAEKVLLDRGKYLVPVSRIDKMTDALLGEIRSERLAGVLVFSLYDKALNKGLLDLRMPAVFLDYIDYSLQADQITTDHQKGGSLAIQKLHELGHARTIFLGNRFERTVGNDPDHEYWWHAVQAEARRLKIPDCRAFFLPMGQDHALADTEKKLVALPGHTGYLCGSSHIFERVKTIVERNPVLRGTPRDAVVFSDLTPLPDLNGRKVWLCAWNTYQMGVKGAEIMLSRINREPHKPAIHYIPIEITS